MFLWWQRSFCSQSRPSQSILRHESPSSDWSQPLPSWNSNSPTQITPSTRGSFLSLRLVSSGKIIIAIGNSLFPWSSPCWCLISCSYMAPLMPCFQHKCRYFVNLLHSRDQDNSLFRMEKHINRIFNEITLSVSYTWTKNCKWLCNMLYTFFFL